MFVIQKQLSFNWQAGESTEFAWLQLTAATAASPVLGYLQMPFHVSSCWQGLRKISIPGLYRAGGRVMKKVSIYGLLYKNVEHISEHFYFLP